MTTLCDTLPSKSLETLHSELRYGFETLQRCNRTIAIIKEYGTSKPLMDGLSQLGIPPNTLGLSTAEGYPSLAGYLPLGDPTDQDTAACLEGFTEYVLKIWKWIIDQIKAIGRWLGQYIPILSSRVLTLDQAVKSLRKTLKNSIRDDQKGEGKTTTGFGPGRTLVLVNKFNEYDPTKFLQFTGQVNTVNHNEAEVTAEIQTMSASIAGLPDEIDAMKSIEQLKDIDPEDYINTADHLRAQCDQCTSALRKLSEHNNNNRKFAEEAAKRYPSEQTEGDAEATKQKVQQNEPVIAMFKNRADIMLVVARDLLKIAGWVLVNGWTKR